MTATDWAELVLAILAILAQVFTLAGWTRAARTANEARRLGEAGVEAIEEFGEEHPKLKKKLKVYAKDKATKLGINLHFEKEVTRITERMKKKEL